MFRIALPFASRSAAAKTALAALALASFGAMAPAGAADTALTLTLTNSGALSISAPATAVGTAEVTDLATNATIDVEGVEISDLRTLPGAFTATATATDLVGGTGTTIPAATMLWATTSAVDGAGNPALIVGAGGSLGLGAPMAVGLGFGLGDDTYVLDGTITIPILNATPGTYTSTLTTSVS